MNNKDVKKRDVLGFDKFKDAYDQARKTVSLKKNENAHPGASPIKGETLYVRNDANPYKAMGIEHDEEIADNNRNMTANQVDVFHDRKLTNEEKKTIEDAYGNQTVTHHQMAFILDESIDLETRMYGTVSESLNHVKSLDAFIAERDEEEDCEDEEELGEGEKPWEKKEDDDSKDEDEEEVSEGEDADKDNSEDEDDEDDKDPEDEWKEKYDGKTVVLNGDSAKISDEDGIAKIKSDENEVTMSWKEVHEVMSKKDGNFRTKKEEKEDDKEEKKDEDSKED